MKTEFEILLKHYGTKEALANALGVSVRHVYNIEKGNHVGPGTRTAMSLLVRNLRTNEAER